MEDGMLELPNAFGDDGKDGKEGYEAEAKDKP